MLLYATGGNIKLPKLLFKCAKTLISTMPHPPLVVMQTTKTDIDKCKAWSICRNSSQLNNPLVYVSKVRNNLGSIELPECDG
jgi:hypothetical protein